MPGMYTRDFQIGLLAQLFIDDAFGRAVSGYLKLTDFELPACRLIYEALVDYRSKYNAVPDFSMLSVHVQYMLQNPNGATETLLDPTEFESLAGVLGMIANTIHGTTSTEYYQGELKGYLATVRMGQLQEQHGTMLQMGQGAQEYISEIAQLDEAMSQQGSDDYVIDYADSNPEPIVSASDVQRIATGIAPIDNWTSNGLGIGECGMIVACTGVGKTTGLINILNAATSSKWRGLFMTLELSGARIKRRRQSILAGIPAEWFKVPILAWPPEMMERFDWIINPDNPAFDRAAIVDMSKRAPTVDDIDTMIKKWLEGEAKRGTVDKCKIVCLDWLDKMDPGGLRGINKNMNESSIHIKVSEALAELGRKHEVVFWWATQATKDAEGREVLSTKHTAYGYHKNDALDLSIGLAPASTDADKAGDERFKNDDDETMPACDRKLVVSVMKNRDNPAGSHAEIYQGPTLKFWTEKKEYNAMEELLQDRRFHEYSEQIYADTKKKVNYAYPKFRAAASQ